MIMMLCPEHQELAGVYTPDQIRDLWTWWNCSCLIVDDRNN